MAHSKPLKFSKWPAERQARWMAAWSSPWGMWNLASLIGGVGDHRGRRMPNGTTVDDDEGIPIVRKGAGKMQMIDGELQEEFGDEFRADQEVIRPQSRPVVPIEVMREAMQEMVRTKRERKQRSGKPTPEQVAEVVRLYEKGMSTLQIAGLMNTSDVTVGKWLKAEGVEMRPRQRYKGKPDITVQAPGFGAAVTEVPIAFAHLCEICGNATTEYRLSAQNMKLCGDCWQKLVVDKQAMDAAASVKPMHVCDGCGNEMESYNAGENGAKLCNGCWIRDVQTTNEKILQPVTVLDDEPAEDLPPHLRVSAEALVRSIDEHNASQPRYHHAEDNLEEFLREYFGNLAPKRLYQLPEHIREAADKLTRALFEGRAA